MRARALVSGVPLGDPRLAWVETEAIRHCSAGMRPIAAVECAWAIAVGPKAIPHPRSGTRWQRKIEHQPPGRPLAFGKPDHD